MLVALPGVDIEAVQREVDRQCDLLPRAETTRRALTHSCIVQVGSKQEAADFSNRWVGWDWACNLVVRAVWASSSVAQGPGRQQGQPGRCPINLDDQACVPTLPAPCTCPLPRCHHS